MAQVTLTTDVKNFHLETPRAAASSGTVPNKVTQVALPASGAGTVVFGTSLNYVKIKTIVAAASTNLTLYVYGWSFSSQLMAYVPQLLFSTTSNGAVAGTTNQTTFPGGAANMYEIWQYTKSTGDAKIFNAPSVSTAGGFILIDTLGCQFIDVCATASAGNPNFYVMHSGV
jgi:hypothetical protein